MSASEIQPEKNRFLLRMERTIVEYIAVIIASVSGVLSIIAVLLSTFFGATTLLLVEERSSMADEHAVTDIYLTQLHAQLEAEGFEPPPLPERFRDGSKKSSN